MWAHQMISASEKFSLFHANDKKYASHSTTKAISSSSAVIWLLGLQHKGNNRRHKAHEINLPSSPRFDRRLEIAKRFLFSGCENWKQYFTFRNCKCLCFASLLFLAPQLLRHLALFLCSRFCLLAQFNFIYYLPFLFGRFYQWLLCIGELFLRWSGERK